jgi:hypothetical protein
MICKPSIISLNFLFHVSSQIKADMFRSGSVMVPVLISHLSKSACTNSIQFFVILSGALSHSEYSVISQ